MLFTDEHLKMIRERARWSIDRANEHFGVNIGYPDIEISGRLKVCAGKARSLHHRINISEKLFLENMDDMLLNTVPHECAHLIANIVYGDNCEHDHRWAKVMTDVFGLQALKTHNYQVEQRQVLKYVYKCGCKTHLFAPKRHALAQHENPKKHKTYFCNRCKHVCKFTEQIYAPHKDGEYAHYDRVYDTATKHTNVQLTKSGSVARPHGSKTSHAREIMKEMKGKSRYDVIARFVSEVGLTPAGANTYYYNLSKEDL